MIAGRDEPVLWHPANLCGATIAGRREDKDPITRPKRLTVIATSSITQDSSAPRIGLRGSTPALVVELPGIYRVPFQIT